MQGSSSKEFTTEGSYGHKAAKGCINLGFVDALTEESSWYQPYIQRELAVKV